MKRFEDEIIMEFDDRKRADGYWLVVVVDVVCLFLLLPHKMTSSRRTAPDRGSGIVWSSRSGIV